MATEVVSTLIERYASGTWSDISSFVIGDIEGEYLIPSNKENEKLAAVGRLNLVVDNESGNFSPNQYFQRGTPIRVTTTYDGIPKVKFLGTILDVDPDTLEWGDQYVRVLAVDWLNFAVNFPVIIPQIQTNMTVDQAVAHLLSLMPTQPDSRILHGGSETFTAVFDTIKTQTRAYSELNKLALSEFAPIYMRGGGLLVVESADTRHGMRELTQVPVRPTDSAALLADPNGYAIILQENGFAILLDQITTPNLSGTFMDVDIQHGKAMANQVLVRAYPSRVDTSPQTLFQLDKVIPVPSLSTIQIKGTWANPDGGSPINAINIEPMVTGTHYTGNANVAGDGQDLTDTLTIVSENGTDGFIDYVTCNNAGGIGAWLQTYTKKGYGIYPYNPIEFLVGITGSFSRGVSYLEIDQKYQDSIEAGRLIANRIADEEKDPRNELISITFDASSSVDLMQASQYIDIGDLTYISNVKPAMDTYAYIQGKKFTITPAGVVTETWYLKEMDSLRKGLRMIALRTAGVNAGRKNSVNFGTPSYLSNLPKKTITFWIRNWEGALSQFPPVSRYGGVDDASAGWHVFQLGTPGHLQFRQNFDPDDGVWNSATPIMSGTMSAWHHVAVSYDSTSLSNLPKMYLDGVSHLVTGSQPTGEIQEDDNVNLMLLNFNTALGESLYNSDVRLKDVRLYDRLLEPHEILFLANNPDNYLLIPDGLVFQAPCVKTEDYAGITGTILYPTDKLIDNIYGIRGTPGWNIPSGTAFALKAFAPS